MKAEKSPRSPSKGPDQTREVVLKKKLAFLYLGTKGRLPNRSELEQEMSGCDAEGILPCNPTATPEQQGERSPEENPARPTTSNPAAKAKMDNNLSYDDKEYTAIKNPKTLKSFKISSEWKFIKKLIIDESPSQKISHIGLHRSREDFNLKSNIHLPINKYNALKDFYLRSYFVDTRVKTH
jgi:hypothetical protein